MLRHQLLKNFFHSSFSCLYSISSTHYAADAIPLLNNQIEQWGLPYLQVKLPEWSPHTFLVTKQAKGKEARFQHYTSRPGFSITPALHGTHPSRLPNIFSRGLLNLSGTNLQTKGAWHGKGIYLTLEHNMALAFARPVVL